IHRDVKPHNVLIDPSGRFFLADFGLAKAATEAATTSAASLGTIGSVGTPAYMSPEQIRGLGGVDYRADVYSLAAMTFELLTGTIPYSGDVFAIMYQHCEAPIPSAHARNRRLPATIDAVLRRGLAKQPEERFQSIWEFVLAVRAALAGETVTAAPVAPTIVAPPSPGPIDPSTVLERPAGGAPSGEPSTLFAVAPPSLPGTAPPNETSQPGWSSPTTTNGPGAGPYHRPAPGATTGRAAPPWLFAAGAFAAVLATFLVGWSVASALGFTGATSTPTPRPVAGAGTPTQAPRPDQSALGPSAVTPSPSVGVAASPPPKPGATPVPGGAPTRPPGDGQIRIGVESGPRLLDPAGLVSATELSLLDYAVESLVALGADGQVLPALAEAWQVSPDGKTYTFKLRPGVTFHDGARLDADTVKLNLERVLNKDLQVPLRAPLDQAQRVETSDSSTVRIVLKEPLPGFLLALTGTQYGILSPAQVRASPTRYVETPIGTGPYRYQDYQRDSRLVYERYDGYWGRKPFYKTVTLVFIVDEAARQAAFQAGEIQVLTSVSTAMLASYQTSGAAKVVYAPNASQLSVFVDLARSTAVRDVRVRQALNYAVDKEALVKAMLGGAGDVLDSPVPPGVAGYCKVGPYAYDPNRARQLLAEAGQPNPALKLLFTTFRADLGRTLAEYLTAVGVKVEQESVEAAVLFRRLDAPPERATTDLTILATGLDYPDASLALRRFRRANWPPASPVNYGHYSNRGVDDLLKRADVELDPRKRGDHLCDAAKQIWQDAPAIFLWSARRAILHSSSIRNVLGLQNGKFSAIYAEPN
ncbi:MAG: protein kinase, partial [Chloroflexi bacterium]|nr:protein kinase [Chloroflexota bacterium]